MNKIFKFIKSLNCRHILRGGKICIVTEKYTLLNAVKREVNVGVKCIRCGYIKTIAKRKMV